jgi:hypothetical protein
MTAAEMAAVEANSKVLTLPTRFNFSRNDVYDFDLPLSWFDWTLKGERILIDLTPCKRANYQALSLLVLYAWHLNLNKCKVIFKLVGDDGAAQMWTRMGARGWYSVLHGVGTNFKSHSFKPLFALRSQTDFRDVLMRAEEYTDGFDVEYEKTLRYVLSELLYNTYEHGQKWSNNGQQRFPSLVQFTWYETRNELAFIVADLGIGIKAHLEHAYPAFESHTSAIRNAIKPQVSGTFVASDPYAAKNNAGVGLFLSTNIIRKLRAEMFIVSGDGLLHVSPRDITGKDLKYSWPGTFVFVTLKIKPSDRPINLHAMMAEFRESAAIEITTGDATEGASRYTVNVYNFFTEYAEDKEGAVRFRDRKLLPAIAEGKSILLNFDRVVSAPHSFLSALLATPIMRLGMTAYKLIKVTNAVPEIRETIDFILDENTDKKSSQTELNFD